MKLLLENYLMLVTFFLKIKSKIIQNKSIGKLRIIHIVKNQNIYHICSSGVLKNISTNILNIE